MQLRRALLALPVSGICFGLVQATPQGPAGVRFINKNHAPMHISMDWAASDEAKHGKLEWSNRWIESGGSIFLDAPRGTSPKYFIGPVLNDRSAKVQGNRDHNTIVEATFGGYDSFTYYDVDIEKGFSVPIWCHGSEDDPESGSGCMKNVLDVCPEGDKHYDAATGIYDYCVGRKTQESIDLRTSLCPHVYVLWNDEQTKTINNKSNELVCTIGEQRAYPKKKANIQRSAEHAAYRRQQMGAVAAGVGSVEAAGHGRDAGDDKKAEGLDLCKHKPLLKDCVEEPDDDDDADKE